jgi:L-iditol 2-dehydrogenase
MTAVTMQAFVKHGSTPGDAGLTTVNVPEPGEGEALIRVAACGICGSDLHAVACDPGYEWVRTPRILGHESAGTVAAVAPGCQRVRPGDQVVPVSIQGCLRCDVCVTGATQLCPHRVILGLDRDGALAEYLTVPEAQLVPVPPGLNLVAAALTEPLTVAVHAALDRTRIEPGTRVVVTGPGTIGLLCAQLARAAGGDVLVAGARTDTVRRLPLARRLGLHAADIESRSTDAVLRRHFGSRQPDTWIEASGAAPALQAALESVRAGGQVTIVAMYAEPLSLLLTGLIRREVAVLTSYAASISHYVRALDLLRSGVVDAEPLLDRFPLARADEAFTAARQGRAVKPLLIPDDRDSGRRTG